MSAPDITDDTPRRLVFPVKVVHLHPEGQGYAIYGSIDELGQVTQTAERRIIGTGRDDDGALIPVCWDAINCTYFDARTLEGFLGIEFDSDEDENEEDETEDDGELE